MNYFSGRFGASIAGRCFMFAGVAGGGRGIVAPIAGTSPGATPTERLRGDIGERTGAGKPIARLSGDEG